MYKLLLTCVGRRVQLVQWLTEEMEKIKGKVICADIDINAPALYYGHEYIINKGFFYEKICREKKITHITSFIDTLLVNIATKKDLYTQINTKVLLSHPEIIMDCTDKLAMYNKYNQKFNVVPSRSVVKDQYGSSSSGMRLIHQPFLEGKEYNAQLYFDFITGELSDVYMQEKILMRAGETERVISVWDELILEQLERLQGLGFKGPIDIDLMTHNNKVYIIDINPRFGGGYQMAHIAGCNFVAMMVRNIQGIENRKFDGKCRYTIGKTMAKYDVIHEGEI